MRVRNTCDRKDGEKEQFCTLFLLKIQANPSRITPAKLLCECLYVFVGRAGFEFFVHFENAATRINARRHAVCLLALSRSDRRVLGMLLREADCAALCYTVLCLRQMLDNILVCYILSITNGLN